jgi:hypothetical protein
VNQQDIQERVPHWLASFQTRRRTFVKAAAAGAIGLVAGVFPELNVAKADTQVVFCHCDTGSWCCSIGSQDNPSGLCSCGNCGLDPTCTLAHVEIYVDCESVFGCNSCYLGCYGPYYPCTENCGLCPAPTESDVCFYCSPAAPC